MNLIGRRAAPPSIPFRANARNDPFALQVAINAGLFLFERRLNCPERAKKISLGLERSDYPGSTPEKEVVSVQAAVGNCIDWFQVIEHAILEKVPNGLEMGYFNPFGIHSSPRLPPGHR
jgi:hypothetical protein